MLAVVTAGLFVTALDTYVVVTVLPRVMTDLGVALDRPERASAVISGFLLGYIVTMPLLGAVSDARGRDRVFMGCLAVFALGSLVTATAGLVPGDSSSAGLPWLVAGRVLQGLGGGALVPVAMALAADTYAGGRRARALGVVAGVQELGSVVGPLYGALLVAAAEGLGGWRLVFWVNVPLAALCAGGVAWAMRGAPNRAGLDTPASRRRVDWPGGLLLGVGLGALVLALYPDDPSQRAVGPLFLPLAVVAVVVLAGFVVQQARRDDSLIPVALMRDPVFLGATLTNLLVGVGLMVALVDIPVFADGVFNLAQLPAALLLSQFMVAIPVGALAGGRAAAAVGYRVTATLGMMLAALAYAEMSTWGAGELGLRVLGVPPTTVTLLLLGLGFGLVIAPVAAAILDRSGRSAHGLASSLVVLARVVGMLVGLSALAAFGVRRFNELVARGAAIPQGLSASALESAIRARVTSALVQEYHEVFALAALVCALAAIVAAASLTGRPRPTVEIAAGEPA